MREIAGRSGPGRGAGRVDEPAESRFGPGLGRLPGFADAREAGYPYYTELGDAGAAEAEPVWVPDGGERT